MIIGVPKEIKNHEYRVGMVPSSVRELTAKGHDVFVETSAGSGIGFSDQDYINVGAVILDTAAEVFAKSEMIVKVKEPQAVERAMLREDQLLFTYLHLAPDLPQTEDLIKSGAVCIAYETVTDDRGALPYLHLCLKLPAACLSSWCHGTRKVCWRTRYATRWRTGC